MIIISVSTNDRDTYFSQNSKKFRPYKIKYGKKKQLVSGYIEKRKYFQDTRGEKEQVRRLRRKITPTQNKILIARLKKARAIRMRNLKKTMVKGGRK
jgi:DNA-binding PadR family transcriptional regulator